MTKRYSHADRNPKFMENQEFEDAAALMLAEYSKQHGHVSTPPVPIDDIIEEHLKLAIEIRDLRMEYPEGDVLGAIYFNDKKIVVDQSLVPEDNPSMLGRYRFTLAHELGHWRLHRHYYLRRAGQRSLLPDALASPNHVLRARQYDPKEVQANRFASCLLMPREMVKREWFSWRGDMEPIYLSDLCAHHQKVVLADFARRGIPVKSDEPITAALYDYAIRPFAEKFQVSAEAMRYRLLDLTLLRPKKDSTLFE